MKYILALFQLLRAFGVVSRHDKAPTARRIRIQAQSVSQREGGAFSFQLLFGKPSSQRRRLHQRQVRSEHRDTNTIHNATSPLNVPWIILQVHQHGDEVGEV